MRYSFNWLQELLPAAEISFSELLSGLANIGLHSQDILSQNGDYLFELEIPANRGDLLSMRGLAREISIFLDLPLPILSIPSPKEADLIKNMKVAIQNPDACPFYSGRLISGVEITETRGKISTRLKDLRFRTINNAVDITNYVLLELGQPLHAFDADKISGNITVRFAKAGEKMSALDGTERKLDEQNLVIADSAKILALAGIIGGKDSEITEGTKNIFLESALFQPEVIRASRKALGVETESSLRFERGIDPKAVVAGLNRAVNLMSEGTDLKSGTPNSQLYCLTAPMVQDGQIPPQKGTISLYATHLADVLGIAIEPDRVEILLTKIGCSFQKGCRKADSFWSVDSPSYRKDLSEESDLIEEVARFYGYDRLPSRLPQIQLVPPPSKTIFSLTAQIKRYLVSAGFDEAVTLNLLSSRNTHSEVKIINPLNQEQETLRESLLPNLIQIGLENIHQGNLKLGLFEIGKVYSKTTQGPGEEYRLGILISGEKGELLFIKSLLLKLAEGLGLNNFRVEKRSSPYLKESVSLSCGEKVWAVFGEVPNAKNPLLGAEVYLEDYLNPPPSPDRFKSWAKFPAIIRDYSFLSPGALPWKEIETKIYRRSELIAQVKLFDLYRSRELPEGFCSITFSVSFQSAERTLTHSEIELIQERIIAELENLGLKLRK
ncbi:MAG: phenylalanine--tRNA ligase subunit beta [Candidatus Omnitrophota bacterium]